MKLFNPPRLTGKYLADVLSSGWLTTGPMNTRLREALSVFLKVPVQRIVLASSATAGFQGVMDLIRRKSNKGGVGVHITEQTWPGMRSAIYHSGCMVVPGEPGVVVLTDIGGRRLIDEEKWDGYKGKTIIHDACHSWLPQHSDFAFMSFYPTKLVPGAEGGAVVCKKEEDAEELRDWLYCGLRPGAAGNGMEPRVPGRKANMTDVSAALNLEALELAPSYIAAIGESWTLMRNYILKYWQIPVRNQPVRPYLLQVEVLFGAQDPNIDLWPERSPVPCFRRALERHGVPSSWNFPPAPLVTLPLWPGMTGQEAADLAAKVEAAWREVCA